MTVPNNPFGVAQWRRAVAEMYMEVRMTPAHEYARAADRFRGARDVLFGTHPESPLASTQRACFDGLNYYPFDASYRVLGAIERNGDNKPYEVNLQADGVLRYGRVGQIRFTLNGVSALLGIFWVKGYGGGLFLPFRDLTNDCTTYGGGRYLYDTIKGADLGITGNKIVLDFNYAYNPSCAYNHSWVCPLPPPENRLPFAIEAGELKFDK